MKRKIAIAYLTVVTSFVLALITAWFICCTLEALIVLGFGIVYSCIVIFFIFLTIKMVEWFKEG